MTRIRSGLGGREVVVGGGDGGEEGLVLHLQAIRPLAAAGLARAAGARVDVEQQRAVGHQAAGAELVDGAHGLDSQAARRALVGQRRVDEAVEQDPGAGLEQRAHPLADELGAGGRVEQRLGGPVDPQRRVLDQRADALGELDAAGLAQQLDVDAALAQLPQQAVGERGLARPVEPLDRDQPARHASATISAAIVVGRMLPGTEDHPHARAVLGAALPPEGRPSHAYLFHGPAGSGKRTVARAFAAALLAEGAADPEGARLRVEHGVHPDLTWVTPSGAADVLVSDIDEPVVVGATRTPFEAQRRVFVIESADALNDQAANRMLKTLEEPAAYAHLVLLTDRPGEILPTIASRCQHVRFDAPSPQEIAERLGRHGVDPATADACARLGLGDAGRALDLALGEGPGAARPGRGLRARADPRRRRAGRASVAGAARRGARPRRRRGQGGGRPLRGRGRVPAQEGGQAPRARRGVRRQARGPPRARARARPRATARGPVAARRRLRRRRRRGRRAQHRPPGRAARGRRALRRRLTACARRSASSTRRAPR